MGRPRSPNPTIVVSIRVTTTFDELVQSMAATQGMTPYEMYQKCLTKGFNIERVSVNAKDSLPKDLQS